MHQIDEAALSAYLDRYMRKYARVLEQRFFRGTLVQATQLTSGAYACSVIPVGSSTAISARCSNPGYFPQPGDDVECIWRDLNTAYVLWAVAGTPGLFFDATLKASQTTILIPNVPQGARAITVDIQSRVASGAGADLCFQMNGDTGTNYDSHRLVNNSAGTAQADFNGIVEAVCGYVNAVTSAPANAFAATRVVIPDYANSVTDKSWTSRGSAFNAYAGAGLFVASAMGAWHPANPQPVSSLTFLTGNGAGFAAGTRVSAFLT